jgi:hypothetical protein
MVVFEQNNAEYIVRAAFVNQDLKQYGSTDNSDDGDNKRVAEIQKYFE